MAKSDSLRNKRIRSERIVRSITFLCALVSIVTTVGIVVVLLTESLAFFKHVSITEFLFGKDWTPRASTNPHFGILPLLSGTMLIALFAGLIAIPLGLLTGVYLSEYASAKVRSSVKPVLELLAGVPTVVYGYFALTFVTPMLQGVIPNLPIFNALSASIVVGVMILPIVASLSEEALAAVPRDLREGGLALGATKGEVIRGIVIPGALSGIMSAFILALSRAVGETMAVTLAAGATPKLTFDPRESIQTMASYIVNVSMGDAPHGTLLYQTIFAVALMLFIITLIMNLIATRLVVKYRKQYG